MQHNIENKLYQALLLHLENNNTEAAEIYLQSLDHEDNACVIYLLGHIAYSNNDFQKAKECYEKAESLNCNIDFKDDFSNFQEVIMLLFMSITEKENIFQIDSWERALKLKPVMAATYINVSKSYIDANDISNALRVCNEGLQQFPEDLDLLLNKGAILLRSNFIEQGWGYHEYKEQIFEHHKLRFPAEIKPKYDGTQNIIGKTVYVYSGAGIGDTIFYSRYLSLLAEMGANVIAKPQQCLLDLLVESNLKVQFISEEIKDEDIVFDYQIPFMSLGNAFKTSKATVPLSQGYLKANKTKSEYYVNNYFKNKELKIGIFWQSGAKDQRSLNLEHFLNLFNINNTQFYSLQKGNGSEQLSNVPEGVKVIDLGQTFNDFTDTAAAIENLDLLIGCDTSIANLAGAMGKPMWILLPYSSDWKWGLFSEKTHWYESARLFRQKEPNNWQEVIQRVSNKILNM